jgi:hypothetical protein
MLNSPIYSMDMYKKFVELSEGEQSLIGIVSSSTADVYDGYLYYA